MAKWKTLCFCKRWQQRLRSIVWQRLSFGDERIKACATVWAVGFRKARSFRLQCNPQLALTPHFLHLKQSHWCNFEQWLLAVLKFFFPLCGSFVHCGHSRVEGMPTYSVHIDRTVDVCLPGIEEPCWSSPEYCAMRHEHSSQMHIGKQPPDSQIIAFNERLTYSLLYLL